MATKHVIRWIVDVSDSLVIFMHLSTDVVNDGGYNRTVISIHGKSTQTKFNIVLELKLNKQSSIVNIPY